jgi:lysozyme
MTPHALRLARLIITTCEGCRLTPYTDSAGVLTVGFGHTSPVPYQLEDGTWIDLPLTEVESIETADAEMLLEADLAEADRVIAWRVLVPVNDHQRAALLSLVFNLGARPLVGTLGRLLNQGDYRGAADEWWKWRRAGGVILPGLVRRRGMEEMLWRMGTEGLT